MPKYTVTFIKQETYEVEADNPYEAEDMALDMYNADKDAFTHEHIDEMEVEEIK